MIAEEIGVVVVGIEDERIIFAEESPASEEESSQSWKILLVDDEPEIHDVTRLALQDLIFEDKKLTFLSAYSGEEAKALIQQHPDTAIIFLDAIMETEEAGLDVVRYTREVLNNQIVQIILRTGQPGRVPEDLVPLNYEINDYQTKTELTRQKLITKVVTSLRAYQTLVEKNQQLEQAEEAADVPPSLRMKLIKSVLDSGQITSKERQWFVASTLWKEPLSTEEKAGMEKIDEGLEKGWLQVEVVD